MDIKDKDLSISSTGEKAVGYTKEIILLRITEQEKTRRLLIIVTAILVIVAAFIMVFGPEERQGTNMIIGIILLVLGMGSIGASQFVIKAGPLSASTMESAKTEQTDHKPSPKRDDLEQTRPDDSWQREA